MFNIAVKWKYVLKHENYEHNDNNIYLKNQVNIIDKGMFFPHKTLEQIDVQV